jgi:hypothetical protein
MRTTAQSDGLPHSIAQVERRMELRRRRLARHAEELREAAEQKAKPLALAGVAGVALAAFVVGRRPPKARDSGAVGVVAKTGALAGLVAMLQVAARVGANPLVRSAWKSYLRKLDADARSTTAGPKPKEL